MAELILMPQKGLTEESAILSYWHVKKGDVVKEGDYLFDIETGKATFSIESEVAGTILATFGSEGDEVLVKAVVCVIGQPGEQFSVPGQADVSAPVPAQAAPPAAPPVAQPTAAPVAPVAPAASAAPAAVTTVTPSASTEGGRLFVSPKARAMASEQGIDLSLVQASGPKGRIIKDDVLRAMTGGYQSMSDSGPGPELARPESAKAAMSDSVPGTESTILKNTTIRKVIARNMHQSLQSMAQLTLQASFDATTMIEVKDRLKAKSEAQGRPGITINDMIVFAVSRTILDFPTLNAHFSDETTTLFHNAHIGVAVDTKAGLMVPTVFNTNRLSLRQISETAKALARDCQEGRATPQMLSGGTFTITNLGALRVESFTPVIAPPQTAILGIGCMDYKARMVNGQISHYPAIGLSLTFDHRAVDGAPAARFLKALCENLEDFLSLLAE